MYTLPVTDEHTLPKGYDRAKDPSACRVDSASAAPSEDVMLANFAWS